MLNGTCNSTLDDMRIGSSEAVLVGGMTFHTIGLIVCAATALIAVLFSLYLIMMHATHYTKPREQRHIIRILFMVPVYAIASFLTFWFYWHAIYFQVMFECYEAFAIASFFALLCHYIAPDLHEQKQYFRSIKPRAWVLPVSWFKKCCGGERGIWRTPRSGLTLFNIIWSGIYQYCFIRVSMTITAVITQYYEKYCESSNSPAFAHIWILVIEGLAVSVAMYMLIQFYIQLKDDLAPHKPLLKVLAIKAVIFLSFWQSFAISILTSAAFSIVTPGSHVAYPDLKIGIPSLLLCIEMAIFSILHLFAFPWKPYDGLRGVQNYPVSGGFTPDKVGPKQGGFLGIKAIGDAMNPWDLVKGFARGMRWLAIGRKHREKDSSYNQTAYDLNNPNNENDMAGRLDGNGFKRNDNLPIADEFRRSKFGMPVMKGSTTKLDDEGAGLISHAQQNPQTGYVPARQRYDENGQDIINTSQPPSRYDSPSPYGSSSPERLPARLGGSPDRLVGQSPDRLAGRNPSPFDMRRQETDPYNPSQDAGITAPQPYHSHVIQEPFVSTQEQDRADYYLEQKRLARQQQGGAPSPSQQWASASQPIRQDTNTAVHSALWEQQSGQEQKPPQPRQQDHNQF